MKEVKARMKDGTTSTNLKAKNDGAPADNNAPAKNRDTPTNIIAEYLNIRIDNYHGVAPMKDLNINLNTFIKFVKMNAGNAQLLRRDFIQGTSP